MANPDFIHVVNTIYDDGSEGLCGTYSNSAKTWKGKSDGIPEGVIDSNDFTQEKFWDAVVKKAKQWTDTRMLVWETKAVSPPDIGKGKVVDELRLKSEPEGTRRIKHQERKRIKHSRKNGYVFIWKKRMK